jgi:hypothetical protein
MKKILSIAFLFLLLNKIQAQTTIDEIEESSHVIIGVQANSSVQFAGQLLGLNGPSVEPAFTYKHKSGIYLGIQPTFYFAPKLKKASTIPELNYEIGYNYENENWILDGSFTYSKINFGSKFFRNYLNNALSISITNQTLDNFGFELNAVSLFGINKSGTNNANIINPAAYYIYAKDDVLGAEQLILKPGIMAYWGSDKLSGVLSQVDSLNGNLGAAGNHLLSIIPNMQASLQANRSEFSLNLYLPIARQAVVYKTLPPTIENKIALGTTLIELSYNFYFGRKSAE